MGRGGVNRACACFVCLCVCLSNSFEKGEFILIVDLSPKPFVIIFSLPLSLFAPLPVYLPHPPSFPFFSISPLLSPLYIVSFPSSSSRLLSPLYIVSLSLFPFFLISLVHPFAFPHSLPFSLSPPILFFLHAPLVVLSARRSNTRFTSLTL